MEGQKIYCLGLGFCFFTISVLAQFDICNDVKFDNLGLEFVDFEAIQRKQKQ